MKKSQTLLLAAVGALALLPGIAAAENPKTRDLTIWVSSKTGSHLGGGYTSTYLTNIRAKTIANEDPKLRNAIVSLDGLGMLPVKGFGLVPAAVAWQSAIPMRKVIQQQADTGLSYGELLMANAIATKSGQPFNEVVASRAKHRTWGEVAEQLGVSPDFIVAKESIAASRIIAADFRTRQRPPRESGTNYTSINPHTQQFAHH